MPVRTQAAVKVDRAPSLLGAKTGLDKRTDQKVRRGRMPIDGRIDLHGMTQDRAHDALLAFVRGGYGSGRRLLLVITGKGAPAEDRSYDGRGVLRSAVPRWLNEPVFRPMVLAVHQAQPQHGGTGALYVFLKRVR
ncbi:Smr/MutS family protein [Indioceanicola profundi]|uniref:Smr/MutS family protein n=1 Tax=Indioceanicola profundi TaxID=2220096 RepID=UPI000E6AB1F7|nr:Smr/MutS family protein [Indioceanicola profundi]